MLNGLSHPGVPCISFFIGKIGIKIVPGEEEVAGPSGPQFVGRGCSWGPSPLPLPRNQLQLWVFQASQGRSPSFPRSGAALLAGREGVHRSVARVTSVLV